MSEGHQWDESYQGQEAPPWDIGEPQPEVAALVKAGALTGSVLDAGCGTGEHALAAAAAGARAVGTDLSATAIRSAKRKAFDRGIGASFAVADMLSAPFAAGSFDAVVDSGLFHSFDDAQRSRYVEGLARIVRSGGACHLMCCSDRQPGDWGPRRITREEIRRVFSSGWEVEAIEPSYFRIHPIPESDGARLDAWRAVLRRL